MPWYSYALIGITINAASDLARRIALAGKNKMDYYSVAFLMSCLICVTLIIYTAIAGFHMPPFRNFWPIFVINISMGVISWLTNQKGLSLLGLSEFTILMTTRQIITLILSVTLLGIGLTLRQGFGVLLVALATIVVIVNRKTFRHNPGAGVFFTLVTAAMYGTAILTDQIIYRQSDPASFMVIGFGLTALILLGIHPKAIRSLQYLREPKRGVIMVITSSLNAIGLIFIFTSLKRADNAPLVSGVFQAQIIVSVLLATIFLRERKNLGKKLIGAGLATFGAILLVT